LKITDIYKKTFQLEFLTYEEGLELYRNAPTTELMQVAFEIRKMLIPQNYVTWMIDRNVNITNVCISQCKFCNFCRTSKHDDAYITTFPEYREKIDELYQKDGDQLLLQGGMHPDLGLDFYKNLFKTLKSEYPNLKLHALGPPEIHYLSVKEKLPVRKVLEELILSGLDSLPGAGAEILSDRVRKIVSPAKCTSQQWLDVMVEAHELNLPTSATMMFGHIETDEERVRHLILLREVQKQKPADSYGFVAFIPWPFQAENTALQTKRGINCNVTADVYIRTIALSRIMLPNITNIQSSWLTVGKNTAQVTLYGGANDFGSIMIEENVVSSAGANNTFDAEGIQKAIMEAGFVPKRRNQRYELVIS
jgi:cyclic dehypoxanthinyl futalosine synthase